MRRRRQHDRVNRHQGHRFHAGNQSAGDCNDSIVRRERRVRIRDERDECHKRHDCHECAERCIIYIDNRSHRQRVLDRRFIEH
jgi:hypothetical protein